MKSSLLYLLSSFIISTLPAVAAGGSGDGTEASPSVSHTRVVPQVSVASGSKPKLLRGALDTMGLVRGGRMAFATGLVNCFEANDVHPTGKKDEKLSEFLKNSGERIKLMMALKEKNLLPSRKLEGPDHWPLSEEDYWKECEYRLKEGRKAPGHRRIWAQWYEEERLEKYFDKEEEKEVEKDKRTRSLRKKIMEQNQKRQKEKKRQRKLELTVLNKIPSPMNSEHTESLPPNIPALTVNPHQKNRKIMFIA